MAQTPRRAWILMLASAASAAIIAVTVLFANVTSLSRVTGHAEELHRVNATLGTAALARAAAGQVVLFEDLAGRGLASTADVRVARRELADSIAALRELIDAAGPSVTTELESLLLTLSTEPLDRQAIEAEYGPAAERLNRTISRLEAEIARSEKLGNYVASAIRVLVVLVIPAAAILIYRKRVADQLREERVKMEALLEAEREISRAKDRFVAGISHEIRTPLTGICGFTELLLDTPSDEPLDRDTIEVIHSEAAELSRMVDDFIIAARIDGTTLEVDRERTGLTPLARSVVNRFERLGASIEVAGDDVEAICDSGRTHQILINLLSNSLRHGGPGISVRLETDGDLAICRVTDDGPGIPPPVEGKLFERFVYDGEEALTTNSLGLGTWVARQLARAMDGDVTYRREEDLTVFTLSLPGVAADSTTEEMPVEAGTTA